MNLEYIFDLFNKTFFVTLGKHSDALIDVLKSEEKTFCLDIDFFIFIMQVALFYLIYALGIFISNSFIKKHSACLNQA
jgi:hypothetical protein